MSPRYPIPERKDAHARPTSNVVPHPRHRAQRLYDAQSPTSRASHPVYNDYELHLVDNDFDHYNFDDDRSRTRGANVTPTDRTPSAVDGGMPTGDRRPDREALVTVRTRGRAVGDRDRLARVELSTRRNQPDPVCGDVPVGRTATRRSVRSTWLRLAHGSVASGTEHRRGRVAICVVGGIALATLIVAVR